MKKIATQLVIAALLVLGTIGIATLLPEISLASPVDEAQQGATGAGAGEGPTVEETILIITNLLLFLIGAAAVIAILIGAIKYVTANGDQSSLTAAKNTILYAVIGLIVAVAAGAIVNFVLNQFAA